MAQRGTEAPSFAYATYCSCHSLAVCRVPSSSATAFRPHDPVLASQWNDKHPSAAVHSAAHDSTDAAVCARLARLGPMMNPIFGEANVPLSTAHAHLRVAGVVEAVAEVAAKVAVVVDAGRLVAAAAVVMDVVLFGVGIVPVAATSSVVAAVVRVVARASVAVAVKVAANVAVVVVVVVAAHGPANPQVTGHVTSLTLLSSEQNSTETQAQSSLASTQLLGCGTVVAVGVGQNTKGVRHPPIKKSGQQSWKIWHDASHEQKPTCLNALPPARLSLQMGTKPSTRPHALLRAQWGLHSVSATNGTQCVEVVVNDDVVVPVVVRVAVVLVVIVAEAVVVVAVVVVVVVV